LASVIVATAGRLPAQGVDRVKTRSGTVRGEVTQVSPMRVVVRGSGGREVPVAVEDIASIALAGEPKELTIARAHLASGRMADAAKALAAIEPSGERRGIIQQEIDFYRAWTAARQALAGTGSVDHAGKAMYRFVSRHANSYHYFQACTILGDLLVERKKYDPAEAYYRKLASAPSPAAKIHGHLRLGNVLLAEGKFPEASAEFDRVLQIHGSSNAIRRDRTEASLNRAILTARDGKVEQAVEEIHHRMAKIDTHDRRLLGRAYVALGNCYLVADRKKDALLAFLHVDLLYNTDPDSHAEALAHLTSLWTALGKPDRAREARELLDQRYANSRWAR